MGDTRRTVLEFLEAGPVSGPALADSLGISRTAVWKHIDALRDEGFTIESTAEGYAVKSVPEYGGLAVEFGLDAPFTVEYHDTITSTNDRARELAGNGTRDRVVLANRQTGGQGRLSRPWVSPPGGIWMSLVLRPELEPVRVPLLTLAAAVAVSDATRAVGVDAAIKWPNDVLVQTPGGARKLAGILTEFEGQAQRVSWAVIGVGVNANIDEESLPGGATSIQAMVRPIDRRRLVQQILETFDTLRTDLDRIPQRWREHADTLNRRVLVESQDGTIEGTAVDITSTGALVVSTGTERITVHAGECEYLRPV